MKEKINWATIGMLIVSIIVIIIMATCQSRMKRDLDISEHNLKVAYDSIEVLELRNGDLVYEIGSHIVEKDKLATYLDISQHEIHDLEKKLNDKIAYISNLEAQIRYQDVHTRDSVSHSADSITGIDTTKIDIRYKDDWLALRGQTVLVQDNATTTFSDIYVPVPLRVGLTDNYNIWVESKNPNVSITDIEGAAVKDSPLARPAPKRWGLSAFLGVGINTGYDPINRQIGLNIGPSVGFAITYDIIQW